MSELITTKQVQQWRSGNASLRELVNTEEEYEILFWLSSSALDRKIQQVDDMDDVDALTHSNTFIRECKEELLRSCERT